MNDYKIECRPQYVHLKYATYRKDQKWLFSHEWTALASFATLTEAEASLEELKDFPKYYRY